MGRSVDSIWVHSWLQVEAVVASIIIFHHRSPRQLPISNRRVRWVHILDFVSCAK